MESGVNLFSQNPNTSNADMQASEIVTNCQSNICTGDVHDRDREKETEDECFMSKHIL